MKFYTKIWNIDNEPSWMEELIATYICILLYYVSFTLLIFLKISAAALMPFDPALKVQVCVDLGLGQMNPPFLLNKVFSDADVTMSMHFEL